MGEIIALAMKDLKVLARDKAGFFFTFFFPLIYALFFGTIFSGAGDDDSNPMYVLMVDQDSTEASQNFVAALTESPELSVTVTDVETARQSVRRGRRVAYILLPEGFGDEWNRAFQGRLEVEMGVDPGRQAEAGLLTGVLAQYSSKRMQNLFSGGGGEPFQPIHVRNEAITVERSGPNNAYAVTFPQGIIWGLMGGAAAFGVSLVIERTNGTLVRLRMSPVTRSQILGGKALACFITTTVIASVLFAIAITVMGVRPNSMPLLAFAIICVSIGFVGIMMLLSVLGRTPQSAGGIGWGVLVFMAMIGGGMIPLFIMPAWLQKLSGISPIKWSILAMEGAVWRGFSFSEMLLPCGILVAVGVVTFLIGVRAFRWMEEG